MKRGKPSLHFDRMSLVSRRFALSLALSAPLALSAAGVQAAWERLGQTPSGAVYRMSVPEGWRAGDGLVVYQHDLSFERETAPDLGPLAELQLQQGYAVVASGYSQTGWAVFASAQDNVELVERFRSDVGAPGAIFTYGTAMGGYIALQMAQDPRLDVDGVLALCPLAAGYRRWDAALDLRVVYDAICAGVADGELPAASDQPWLLDASGISAAGLADIVGRAGACLGLDVAAADRDALQQSRLDRLKARTGLGDDAAVLPQLAYATLGLSDLLRDRGKLAGRLAVGNDGVDYGDADLNAAVRRVRADAFAALEFRLASGLRPGSGSRVISLHGQSDETTGVAHQAWLRMHWPASRLVSAVAATEEPAGCGLAGAEIEAAWDSLRAWTAAADAAAPDAVDLQARCLERVEAGDPMGECRIDPQLEPDIDAAGPDASGPRVGQLDARFSGDWIDAAHPGEQWSLELLDGGTALIYGLTFPAAGGPGDQFWLIGSGRVEGDGIAFDEVHSLQGGGFGEDFDPTQARFRPWGSLRMVFDDCGAARLRFNAGAGFGRGERRLAQARGVAGQHCGDAESSSAGGIAALSGSWYDPQRPGQGAALNIAADGSAHLVLMGYDPGHGEPVWLQAGGRIDFLGRARFERVQRVRGPNFDRGAGGVLQVDEWGRVEIDFPDCEHAVLRYRGHEPAWGSGRVELQRLTRPLGVGDCGL